jgi:transposase
VLHTQFGLSYGKVSALFLMLFGITLSRGAGARINLRAATRLESDSDEILKDVRGSPQIAADEIGWRIGGRIEPTNWRAEQAIRPAVVNRKVWGGNRTATGAKAQSILLSVFETARRGVRPLLDYVSESLQAFGNTHRPKPTLRLAR